MPRRLSPTLSRIPFADHLALELGEGHQDVQRQPAMLLRRELLRDADERDVVLLEQVDQLGEVAERAAEAVDLVDRDDVDVAASMSRSRAWNAGRSVVAPESPRRRTSWRLLSSQARLALDVGFDGLPLRARLLNACRDRR